jgi:hypothetical protein
MKNLLSPLSLLVAAACLLAGCSKSSNNPGGNGASKSAGGAGSPIELKAKWTAGKKYLHEMDMHQDMQITMPGTSAPAHQQMDMQQKFSISVLKERPEGGVELELEFVGEKVSSKMGNRQIMNFDSASSPAHDGADPGAAIFRKIVGAKIRFLTDADGKVEKVEGYDEFVDRISGSGGPAGQMILKGMFNEDTLKQYGTGAQGLPDHPVKIGDSWPFHMDMPAGPIGNLKMNFQYTFTGWEKRDGHNCALLSYTGTMSSEPSTNAAAMSFSIKSGDITGKTWFDPELGANIGGTTDQTMDFDMNMGGQKTDSTMKQNIVVKLVKLSDIPK